MATENPTNIPSSENGHLEPATSNIVVTFSDGTNYKASRLAIERILLLPPNHPDYPLSKPFEKHYEIPVEANDDYKRKYVIAMALIEDGRYRNLRFLMSKFAPVNKELDPEITELRDNLRNRIREALIERGDGREKKQAEEELTTFTKDVAGSRTLDSQEFRKLVGLFGTSRVVDILYRTRPEFRGLAVDRIKSILAEYLGDFLVAKGGFNLVDVEIGLKYLSDSSLKEGLVEVIKDSCLNYNLQTKKGDNASTDRISINQYIDEVQSQTDQFQNEDLHQAIAEVKKYYDSIFEFVKPPNIVDALKEERVFPDIGQLINIKELADKRRVLIADEMGLGKSASAILAKEYLGLRQALIVTPSNVVSTWEDYLSDKKVDGQQVGYFKEGETPKVLKVENLDSLKNPDIETYDYVVISQERLNDQYTQALLGLNFDMLIVDEAHKLKNLQYGVRAANLIKLAQKVEGDNTYLALLSGTPVPNKVEDVAMILKLLYPERFRGIPNNILVRMIINGDYVDLRSSLIPRMQMKSLRESIQIPDLVEETILIEELSQAERDIYEILLEDDEIEAKDKIRVLRQFLLNPELLQLTPGVEGTKTKAVGKYLKEVFKKKKKVVMFVNDFIEDVIRGEKSILPKLELPEDIEIRVIHGENPQERRKIQEELRSTQQKIIVIISGQTADVGVDYSPAEEVIFYNEPWTKYVKKQQLGRVYREGLEHPLKSTTFIVENTIEEGINLYIETKYKAIEKLLRGIPITELEKELLERTEDQVDENLEVNRDLAEYYFSSWHKMVKIFSYVKEIGEPDFVKFLEKYAKDYADSYTDLGNRCYQANASRVSATLIQTFVNENGQNPQELKILDLASGPEMLKRHVKEDLNSSIYSLDLNPKHFSQEGDQRVVGSMVRVPFSDGSFDYVNLALALHYTKFIPSQNNFERLDVLREIHRVLKTGGKAVLNLIYTLDLKDLEQFRQIAEAVGFEILDEYSGEVNISNNYRSRVITLEKKEDFGWTKEELIELIGPENFDGLKMKRTDVNMRDSRRILKEFKLTGNTFEIPLNKADLQVLQDEERITKEGQDLKQKYGSIISIPKEEIIEHGFVRILIGSRYLLFKRLTEREGVIIIK